MLIKFMMAIIHFKTLDLLKFDENFYIINFICLIILNFIIF
ncbi:hypothetical protein CAMGR0001_0504 [Campylobacter gracilis RM3268]|uniref:Uncharacterized protein n=1 Tax=Campylobacter gracilis RM3268 TaxID=553220 RepID=C8PHQ8_9BACT|nr:hypothetical protein CAMGR0001_0504 [Campylobacter gracilis RM3268]